MRAYFLCTMSCSIIQTFSVTCFLRYQRDQLLPQTRTKLGNPYCFPASTQLFLTFFVIKGLTTLTNTVSLYESFIGGHWGCLACFDYSLLSLAALEGPPAYQENLLWHPGDLKKISQQRVKRPYLTALWYFVRNKLSEYRKSTGSL